MVALIEITITDDQGASSVANPIIGVTNVAHHVDIIPEESVLKFGE